MNPLLTVHATGTDPVPMAGLIGWIGSEPVQVPNDHFYRSLIRAGSIVEVAPNAAPAPAPNVREPDPASAGDVAGNDPSPSSGDQPESNPTSRHKDKK